MFRTVTDASEIDRAIGTLHPHVAVDKVLEVAPVRLATVPGFDTAVFPYTTDVPVLNRWGQPLLFGPGSIHVAHTADEFISVAELTAAIDSYMEIAKFLLED
jgi:acetylornithine deacetylase